METDKICMSEEVNECPGCLCKMFSVLPDTPFLSRCSQCFLVFDNPRPSPADITKYYGQSGKYDHWLLNLTAREQMWKRRLNKMRFHKRPGTLLDIGAGIGQFLYFAKSEYGSVYGTEVSTSAVQIAREKYGLHLFSGDIADLVLPQVDNLTLIHVLEHVHLPREFLMRCADLLTNHGVIHIAVPNDIKALAYRSKRLKLAPIDFNAEEIHLSHFTPSTLKRLVESVGFEVIDLSLDPFWDVVSLKEQMKYSVWRFLNAVTGQNFYATIWLTAQKHA